MQDLRMLMVMVKREDEDSYTALFREHGVTSVFGVFCQGTASSKVLSLMGLEKTSKSLLYALVRWEKAHRLMASMISDLGLDMPGNGIALTLPIGSIGGASSLKVLTENQKIIIGEVTDMQEPLSFPYELVIAILNHGHVDSVMAAARAAGAMGGTVLHAKGTSPDGENKFFGVDLVDEKDMILIVTSSAQKNAIMRSIMEQAGASSPAHTVLFSMPVDTVAGLKSVINSVEGKDCIE